jgi:hypothetical protein
MNQSLQRKKQQQQQQPQYKEGCQTGIVATKTPQQQY